MVPMEKLIETYLDAHAETKFQDVKWFLTSYTNDKDRHEVTINFKEKGV